MLSEYQSYMLTIDFLKPGVGSMNENTFFPADTDSLFWCFQICKDGFRAYATSDRTFAKEKELKFQYAQFLKGNCKNKQRLLAFEADIATPLITPPSFILLCEVYNINIIFVMGIKSVQRIKGDKVSYIHLSSDLMSYGIDYHISIERQTQLSRLYFPCESFEKPLKSIHMYTLSKLKEYSTFFQVTEAGETKATLYARLQQSLK